MRRDRSSKQLLVNWVKGPIQWLEENMDQPTSNFIVCMQPKFCPLFSLLLFLSLFLCFPQRSIVPRTRRASKEVCNASQWKETDECY